MGCSIIHSATHHAAMAAHVMLLPSVAAWTLYADIAAIDMGSRGLEARCVLLVYTISSAGDYVILLMNSSFIYYPYSGAWDEPGLYLLPL